jgi:hypothetical protein
MRFLQEPTRGFRFGNYDGSPNDPSRVGHARLLMIVIMHNLPGPETTK